MFKLKENNNNKRRKESLAAELALLPSAVVDEDFSLLQQFLQLCLHLLHKGWEAGIQQAGAQDELQVTLSRTAVAVHFRQRQNSLS